MRTAQSPAGTVTAAVHAGSLVAVLGLFAWLTGIPSLFPSLGPSAYVLAVDSTTDGRRVVGGHVVGVVAGAVAYAAFAAGHTVVTPFSPGSLDALHLAASSVAAVVLTTGGMLATDLRHAPACATTLIVGLGLMPTALDWAVIVVAVVALVGTQRLLERVEGAVAAAR